MPRPKSDLVAKISVSKALCPVRHARYVTLGGSEWLRKTIDAPTSDGAVSLVRCLAPGPMHTLCARVTTAQRERFSQLGGVHWLRLEIDNA